MIGVVLEGGGTRGAYHAGALKALLEEGYEIGAITGTSIGAINGAMFAAGKFERLLEIYSNFDPRMIVRASDEVYDSLSFKDLTWRTIGDLGKLAVETLLQGGLDITPLRQMLDREIDEARLRRSTVRFGLVTIDLKERKPRELLVEEIPEGELNEYILASAYLPYFKSEEKRRYLDGGFYNNIPLDLLLRSGPVEEVFIIRTQSISIHQSLKRDVPITIVDPSVDLGLTMQFDIEKMRENLAQGYYDTLRKLRNMPGRRYCVEQVPENYFFNLFQGLSDEKIAAVAKYLDIDTKRNGKRLLFEQILPTIDRLLEGSFEDYETMGFAMAETLAEGLSLDPYRCYTFEQWIQIISRGVEALEKDELHLDLKDRVSLFFARNIPFNVSDSDVVLRGIGKIIMEDKDEPPSNL